MTRRIADCAGRYRHTHIGTARAEDLREGDRVCIDGEVGRVSVLPYRERGKLVVPLDNFESPTVDPRDLVALVDDATLAVLDWDD